MNIFLNKIKSMIMIAKNRFFSYKFFFVFCSLFLGFSLAWNISSRIKNYGKEIEVIAFDLHEVLFTSKRSMLGEVSHYIKAVKFIPSGKTRDLAWKALKDKWSDPLTATINSAEVIKLAQEEGQRDLVRFIIKNETDWVPNEKTFNLVRELHQEGYQLYICSNISDQGFEILKQQYPEHFKYFDGIFTTAPGTTRKPNPIYFEQFLKRFNLKPEHVLFVDDSKSNCQTARKLGMQTVVFKGSPRSIQKIYRVLKRNQKAHLATVNL